MTTQKNAAPDTPKVSKAPDGQPFIVAMLGAYDLPSLGYTTAEYFCTGTANSYTLSGPQTPDGYWQASPDQGRPYTTRIVTALPDANKFNGTIVVEWLNVTGGMDTPVDWWTMHRELIRGGYAWIGVSAQSVGIEGGAAAIPNAAVPPPLKQLDPARYDGLNHPGDAFSYDIFSQIGHFLHGLDAEEVLGALAPKRIIAVGESQSAVFLTTYVNAVAPLGKAYDGYLIHSRFGCSARMDGAPLLGATDNMPQNVLLRTDLTVPVIVVCTETDVLGARLPGTRDARQPDTEFLRSWEITGTAHADNYLANVASIDSGAATIEALASGLTPTANFAGMELAEPMNFCPAQHYVVQAALRHLDTWIAKGTAPATAVPIELASDPTEAALDAFGNAKGGIRTPWLDVPTAQLRGTGTVSASPAASLVGVGRPFSAAKLNQLYPGGQAEYLAKFSVALSSSIDAGFLLADDRDEILALAATAYAQAPSSHS